MSESESEENFCYFGTPLEPYDEDAFPKKRPISIEDQIATDAQGRRRFHGAFTGGFSAGFFNTVGSLEGWTPTEFKSTRAEKAKNVSQKPQDFMDEEDIGDYGIAPQTVKATNEFSTAKKRSRLAFSEGPIPGEPVLETLLTSGNETVGYLLLKNMGIQEKIDKQQEEEISTSDTKVYGCQMPVQYKISESIENLQYQIPTIYQNSLQKPKSNTFGLGYEGLQNIHVNLFKPSKLVVTSKNKKLSIGGQAFGVGAFEEEDADIYMNDDMSNYDFEMTKEKNVGESKYHNYEDLLFGMFKKSKSTLIFKKLYPLPTIPHSFTGKHKLRKSRFEPVEETQGETHESGHMNPAIRAKYLGENSEKTYTPSKSIQPHSINTGGCNQEVKIEKDDSSNKAIIDITSIFMSDKFVSATEKEDISNILENVKRSETMHGTEQMREAARMKMFGPLTRVTVNWNPCAILCKRFNVPEPFAEKPESRSKKRQKNLIFENQKFNEDDNLFKSGICDDTTSEMNRKDEVTTITETVDQHHFTDKTSQMKESLPEKQQIGIIEEELKEETESFAQDSTEKIGVADKIDLFKAVFCSSSSDSEDEGNNTSQTAEMDKTEQFRSSLAEPLLPKLKPLKQGILSNVSFGVCSEPKNDSHDGKMLSEVEKSEIKSTDFKSKIDPFFYGPEVPNEKVAISGSSKNNLALVFSSSEDEWVEIEKQNKKKKGKHKKKRKKEKHKKHRNERE